MSDIVITFKNRSFLDWLEAKQIHGQHINYATHTDIVHKHVIGHLPTWLAAYAESISEISVPKLSRTDRLRMNDGQLTVAEMDAAGAHLITYKVRRATSPI